MNNCIVNLVTHKYIIGQDRLRKSLLDVSFNGDFLSFIGEQSVGSPSHQQNPYAFKVYAIKKALELGYKKIFWLDASVYAVKDITPVFDCLQQKGIFMEDSGHSAATWSNDNSLNYFGITREEALNIPMYSSGISGFDFENEISVKHFTMWEKSMKDGVFIGSWDNHRHDQTAGTLIAHKLNITNLYSNCGDFGAYIGDCYSTPKDSAVFHLKGLV